MHQARLYPDTPKSRSGLLSEPALKFPAKLDLLLCEKVLGLVSFNELLREDISSGFRRLLHTDTLYHALSTGLGREGGDCFLCHNSNSSDYLISR